MPALVPVADYLRTSYEPYCEYVDGELRPKPPKDDESSSLLGALLVHLGARERVLELRVRPSRHLRISPTRYRIPDVSVFTRVDQQAATTIAPLVTVEIVSPDETWHELNDKIRDHLAMGVGTAIVVDPHSHTVFMASAQQPMHQLASPLRAQIDVPDRGTLEIDFDQVFADMD